MSEQNSFKMKNVRNYMGPILKLWEDPTISEIMINGPKSIFIERKGKLEKTDAQFQDDDSLLALINAIATSVDRRINPEEPRLDARLEDGSRVAAVIRPCSLDGHTVSIRKFTQTNISWVDYIKMGSISEEAARFMSACMFLGKNVLVSGGTGSGKTTLLSLLCTQIPRGQRIIVIEDSAELKIHYDHLVRFETKQADQLGKGEVSIRDLLKSSLRLRPDRIIVGEVRSAEALELISAMNTGHKGCMGTVHANSPEDAIVRVEALASGGDGKLSEKALRYQVSSAIDMIIQISRYQDGSRRVGSISEVLGLNPDGSYNVVPLFNMSRMVRGADGKLQGQMEAVGNLPSFMQEIIDNKIGISPQLFQKKSVA